VSDTDNTKPFWVRIAQNPELRNEAHDHSRGPCTIDTQNIQLWWTIKGHACGYEPKFSATRIYRGSSKAEQMYRNKANGKDRTALRKIRQKLLKMSREDIENSDVQSFAHRHSALWDAW